jgi:hypothetical protein
MPDHNEGSPTVGRGRASEEGVHAGNRNASEVKPNAGIAQEQLADELARARDHLEIRGVANLIIAEWRDELCRRAQRMELAAELIGVDADEEAALREEVQRYKRTCLALHWSPSARRRS